MNILKNSLYALHTYYRFCQTVKTGRWSLISFIYSLLIVLMVFISHYDMDLVHPANCIPTIQQSKYFVSKVIFFHSVSQISGVELVIFLLHYNSNILYDQEKVVVMGDCCYVNPMVRRTFRFLGNLIKNIEMKWLIFTIIHNFIFLWLNQACFILNIINYQPVSFSGDLATGLLWFGCRQFCFIIYIYRYSVQNIKSTVSQHQELITSLHMRRWLMYDKTLSHKICSFLYKNI